MEQDRYYGLSPDPGLCGCDRDLFRRVWRRVMPQEEEGCPIELAQEQEKTLALPSANAGSCALSAAVASSHVNTFALSAPDMGDGTGRANRSTACLGADSAASSERLQRMIAHELADRKLYGVLAGYAGAGVSAVLARIAADEYRHAKRLSVACFLISGIRFWPDRQPVPFLDGYLGTLRRRFFSEQQGEAEYLRAAAETKDPLLHSLYLKLAGDEARHSLLIRSILELQI